MKTVLKVFLMAVAYLALFILGAWSGAIHPACYAYIGAVLPLVSAFIYINTCTLIRGFGAATALNGFIFVLFLIAGEADLAYIIGTVVLTALAEMLRKLKGYDTLKGVRWSFVLFAFSFFAYTLHWWTDTEGSLAAAVEEMSAGYDELMKPQHLSVLLWQKPLRHISLLVLHPKLSYLIVFPALTALQVLP